MRNYRQLPTKCHSTRLLVSCRSLDEIRAAVQGGADIIDLKEPRRGPLGVTAYDLWSTAQTQVGTQYPVTAAAGELQTWLDDDRPELLIKSAGGLAALKFGTASLAANRKWQQQLAAFAAQMSVATQIILVAYADHDAARAPAFADVLAAARAIRSRYLLIDTFDKAGPSLCQLWSVGEIQSSIDQTQSSGLQIAVAGRLTRDDLPCLAALGADVVGVRSAACAKDCRDEMVDSARVQALQWALLDQCGAPSVVNTEFA